MHLMITVQKKRATVQYFKQFQSLILKT